jgi:hypothetical protein
MSHVSLSSNFLTGYLNPIQEPLFEKYIWKKENNQLYDCQNQLVSPDSPVEFSGCFAITRDTKHTGWLHKLICLAQKIHSFLFRRQNVDTNYSHGLIIVDGNSQSSKFTLAHAVIGRGICTTSRDYLKDDDITEIVIWKPRDPTIRESLKNHALQTAYTDERFRKPAIDYGKKKIDFSVVKMGLSVFGNRQEKQRKSIQERVSHIAADLLLGNQLGDRHGVPERMFCIPYVFSVLQGTLLVNSLSEDEKKALQTNPENRNSLEHRNAIANRINERLKTHKLGDPLAATYWNNPLFTHDSSLLMSCDAAKTLDQLSNISVAHSVKNKFGKKESPVQPLAEMMMCSKQSVMPSIRDAHHTVAA